MRDWENFYKERGEVQAQVPDIVKNSLKLLEKNNVRKVLDLCFGTGRNTIFLAEKGFDVYGIEISKTGKKITEKKVKEKNLKNVHLQIADMRDLPYENNFFDAIIAVHSIQHTTLSGVKKTISELERVLKHNGIVVATLISTKDPRYKSGKEIEPDTFMILDDPAESDVPHRFSNEEKVRELSANFNLIELKENFGYSEIRKEKNVHWNIIAEKL